jgi:hypothetical protein
VALSVLYGLVRRFARPRFTWSDRALMSALARLVPRARWASFLVTPETILSWHRALVRRRWTYPHRRPGRPALPQETVEQIVRLARENPRWGYLRIVGELKKVGIAVSKTSVAVVLRGHRLPPAPRRLGPTWSEFLRAQAKGLLAHRLLHRRLGHTAPLLRCLRHRDRPAKSAPARRHRQLQGPLGHSGGPQFRLRPTKMLGTDSGSLCETAIPSSPPASTPCSPPLASWRSGRPSPRLELTPSPSGSCEQSARTASTTSSSSLEDISRPCSPTISTITTKPGPTAASTSICHSPALARRSPPLAIRSSVAMFSAASSTSTSVLPEAPTLVSYIHDGPFPTANYYRHFVSHRVEVTRSNARPVTHSPHLGDAPETPCGSLWRLAVVNIWALHALSRGECLPSANATDRIRHEWGTLGALRLLVRSQA